MSAAYTSQPIFAPIDQGGTLLLAPPQNSIGVLGQIYGRAADSGTRNFAVGVSWWTRLLSMHKTTEWCQTRLKQPPSSRFRTTSENTTMRSGYLWNVKQRDSNDFIPMSAALAGSDAINRGAPFGMVRYRPTDGLSLVAMDYNVQDFINAGFAQIEYDFKQPAWIPNWMSAQTSSISEALEPICSRAVLSRPIKHLRRRRCFMSGWTLFLAGSMTGPGSSLYTAVRWKPQLHRHAAAVLRQRK